MAEQLTFDLPVRISLGRGDFFVSEANAQAVARLDAVESWPLGKLVLVGPEASGKTHLAHVWAEANRARIIDCSELADLEVGQIDVPMALDNADRVDEAGEITLFHLHNHLASQGMALLLTAREAPARWSVALPDLKSRMEATDIARIRLPDDALLTAVLVKLFADRQLAVTPSAIRWVTGHLDRSFAEAQRVVARLDAVALSERRAVTRELAMRVLDKD